MDSEDTSEIPFHEKYPIVKQFIYKGIIIPQLSSPERMAKLPDFEIRHNDICIATYPRTGTRFVSEMISWVYHEGDDEKFKHELTFDRFPYLEFSTGTNKDLDYLSALPLSDQRFFVTHLSTEFAPKQLALDNKGKTVCVFRNPKDTAVSFYNFYRMINSFGPYTGSWEEFLQAFCDGDVVDGSYFDFVTSWWERKDQKNILFLRYEEMKKKPRETIQQLAEFLGKSLSDNALENAVQKTSVEHMKNDPNLNISIAPGQDRIRTDLGLEFVNKGQVGEWKKYFTVAQNEDFEKLIEEKLGDTALVFDYM